MRDLSDRNPNSGATTVTRRYGYLKDENGDWYRENWIIACDKPGRVGPFTMTRVVTYGDWTYDGTDEKRPR